jgi:multiple sugar transport system substrate-binding protein
MRWYRFFALATIIVLLLSACAAGGDSSAALAPSAGLPDSPRMTDGPSEPPPTEPAASAGSAEAPVTIGFGGQQIERQVYEPLISAFNAQNPGIHVQFVSLDEVIEANDAANAGPSGLLRRVTSAADTAAFFVTPADIKNKYVQDLKPFMDADATFDSADYYPGALALFGQDAGIYAMPQTLPIPLLSYNKDLWAARGLAAPTPDMSWSNLAAFAAQLAQKRNDKVDTYGMIDQQGGVLALSAELNAAGINIATTPREQLQLEQPEFATALKHVVDLINSGAIYVQPQAQSSTPGVAQQLILDQRVGLWPPDALFDGPKEATPSFGIGTLVFPNPVLPFSGSPRAYLMSAGTSHQLEAWRWLSFLSHQPVTLPYERPDRPDRVPARKSVAEQSGYWSKLDAETKAAVTAALAHPPPPLAAFDAPSVPLVGRVLAAAVQGTKPVAQILHDAQATLNQQIASVQSTPTPDTAPIIVAPQAPDVAPAGATTINFSTLGLGSDQTRRIVQEFNQTNSGVFVKLRNIDLTKQTPQLADLTSSADCFDWFGPPVGSAVSGLLDLQPLADADAGFQLADYPATLLAPFKRSSALYGLPYKVNFRVLAYNQTAFDSAGLPHPTADWTPDDFLNTAQHLTSGSGAKKLYGFVAPDDQSEPLLFFMRRFGASLVRQSNGTQQPNFSDPVVLPAIRYYLDLLRSASPHTRLNGYGGQPDNSFLLTEQGQAGMWFTFGLDPENYQSPDFKVAIAPPPLGTSRVTADDLQVSGLYISASSQHPEACWTWLKYLSSAVAGLAVGFPARSSVAESQAFANQAPPGALDVYNAYRAAFERTSGSDIALDRSQIDLYWFFRAVDQALQGKDLERELADAQTMTEQYVACVQTGTAGRTCALQVDPSYHGTSTAAATPTPQ